MKDDKSTFNHLHSIAEAIKARGESINPVEQDEMQKILECVMTLGFKIGVNEGMKYENKEAQKRLRSLARETERRDKPWYTFYTWYG
tara:strand:- start:661 stop:921 length:261 start_codon:yes stop_codon:yes gene_type:complete